MVMAIDVQLAGSLIAVIAAITGVLVAIVSRRLFSVKVGSLEIEFDRDFKPTDNLEVDSFCHAERGCRPQFPCL